MTDADARIFENKHLERNKAVSKHRQKNAHKHSKAAEGRFKGNMGNLQKEKAKLEKDYLEMVKSSRKETKIPVLEDGKIVMRHRESIALPRTPDIPVLQAPPPQPPPARKASAFYGNGSDSDDDGPVSRRARPSTVSGIASAKVFDKRHSKRPHSSVHSGSGILRIQSARRLRRFNAPLTVCIEKTKITKQRIHQLSQPRGMYLGPQAKQKDGNQQLSIIPPVRFARTTSQLKRAAPRDLPCLTTYDPEMERYQKAAKQRQQQAQSADKKKATRSRGKQRTPSPGKYSNISDDEDINLDSSDDAASSSSGLQSLSLEEREEGIEDCSPISLASITESYHNNKFITEEERQAYFTLLKECQLMKFQMTLARARNCMERWEVEDRLGNHSPTHNYNSSPLDYGDKARKSGFKTVSFCAKLS